MDKIKETEEWKKVISDMANIVKDLEKSKSKKTNAQVILTTINIVIGVVFLVTLISSPFSKQKKNIESIKKDVSSIQQFLWVEETKSHDYLENPFTSRSIKISLYGSEMYCKLAYNKD